MWPEIRKKRHRVSELSDVKRSHTGVRSSPTYAGEPTDPACAGLRENFDGVLSGVRRLQRR